VPRACPGMDVLDVGCGVRDVSFLVSELVGLEGSVVGIDIDGGVLAPCRKTKSVISNIQRCISAG
jgi:ubiquinone/menaquinone biosynthesis C-methylase UbiE